MHIKNKFQGAHIAPDLNWFLAQEQALESSPKNWLSYRLWCTYRKPFICFCLALMGLIAHTLLFISFTPEKQWPYELNSQHEHTQASLSTEQTSSLTQYTKIFTPRVSPTHTGDTVNKSTPDGINYLEALTRFEKKIWQPRPIQNQIIPPSETGHWFSITIPANQLEHLNSATILHLGLPLVEEFILFDISDASQQPKTLATHASTSLENISHTLFINRLNTGADIQLAGYFKNKYPTLLKPSLSAKLPSAPQLQWGLLIFCSALTGVLLITSTRKISLAKTYGFNLYAITLLCGQLLFLYFQPFRQWINPIFFLLLINTTLGVAWHYNHPKQSRWVKYAVLCLLFLLLGTLANNYTQYLQGTLITVTLSLIFMTFSRYYWAGTHLPKHAGIHPDIQSPWASKVLSFVTQYIPAVATASIALALGLISLGLVNQGIALESLVSIYFVLITCAILGHATAIASHWLALKLKHRALKKQIELEAKAAGGLLRQLMTEELTYSKNKANASKSAVRDLKDRPSKSRLTAINTTANPSSSEKVADYADIAELLSSNAAWNAQMCDLKKMIEQDLPQWDNIVHRHNRQLIASLKPQSQTLLSLDKEKLTYIIRTFVQLTAQHSGNGNITMRLGTVRNQQDKLLLKITFQDHATQLTPHLLTLLESNWEEISVSQLSSGHLKYLRLLVALRWIHLNGGHFDFSYDPIYGSQYQITLHTYAKTKPEDDFNRAQSETAKALLMTYDAEYAATMAEQANAYDTQMSLATSVKQAKQNLEQAQRTEEAFDLLIFDFSRDAESLQGFILELRENPAYDQTTIVLLTQNAPWIEYLTHIFKRIIILARPSYYPSLAKIALTQKLLDRDRVEAS